MSTQMKLRNEVRWFASRMEDNLRENDHKGKAGWKGCRFRALFSRLRDESDELLVAAAPRQIDTMLENLTDEQRKELIDECADIANFAMMIADNLRG